MDELTKEYVILFNGITNTISELENTIVKLQVLQQKAEDAILQRECGQDGTGEPLADGTTAREEDTCTLLE